jgi:hypothetical protein
VRHVRRGGRYLRIADPGWSDPLSPDHARRRGGRWNPPARFGVIYLNASVEVARAQVRHRLAPRGIRPEDLAPERGPVLVSVDVRHDDYLDAVTAAGVRSLGLPAGYPLDDHGDRVAHAACQPIGQRAADAGERGIACRSTVLGAPAAGEELALFTRRSLRARRTQLYADWF